MTEPPIGDVVRKIVEALHPQRIIMFGSRARGEAGAGSDLDLLIVMHTDLPPARRIMLVDGLFGLRSWPMDVVVYTPQEYHEQQRYRNSLVRSIEPEAKVLYEQP